MGTMVIRALDADNRRDRAAFVDCGRHFARQTPHSVPQIRSEQLALIDPRKNPFFEHAEVQLFLAEQDGKPVGRISAHIDHLALEISPEQGMGPGTGMFGYFDAESRAIAARLLETAEDWLRTRGMVRVLGPISLSVWEEPGLLVRGHDHSPTVMMGHHPEHYRAWIEGLGYRPAKSLFTYDLDITKDFQPIVQRIVQSGERNDSVVIRPARMDRFDEEVRIIMRILNDAWSDNWGFVPFTEAEIDHAAKSLKQIVHPELIRIAELDGEPVAFMITLPDANEPIAKIGGKLLPFGWLKMLLWLRKPKARTMRVPLMGVLKAHQNSRLASQLAFMMITYIKRDAIEKFGSSRGELGWVLDDNQGMIAIARMIQSEINREYVIYQKTL